MEFGIAPCDALVGADVPPDRAKEVVLELEKQMFDTLATKQHLAMLGQRLTLQITLQITLRIGR